MNTLDNEIKISPYLYPGLIDLPPEIQEGMGPQKMADRICEYFKITRQQLTVRSRQREIVYYRQVTAYVLNRLYGYRKGRSGINMVLISRIIGAGQERTTILHSIKVIKQRMEDELSVRLDVNLLINLNKKPTNGNQGQNQLHQ